MAELSQMGRTGSSGLEYESAGWRVERKRKFRIDLVMYVVINLFFMGVWAVTGFGIAGMEMNFPGNSYSSGIRRRRGRT